VRLDRYLSRIGYRGDLAPNLTTLTAVHRAHLHAISYENLDIHLGRPLVLGAEAAYRKIVLGNRGGWCYEMNGLLAWALREIGFHVRYLSGAVGREARGPAAEGNHLVLLVELDQPYLADVGFGDGFLDPLPLVPGRYRQGPFEFGLERADEWWRVRNHQWGAAPSFDFTLADRRLDEFAAQCRELQTSPTSGFVQKTVCQRFGPEGIRTLRGAVFRRITALGVAEHVIDSVAEYRETLASAFDLCVDRVDELWSRVWALHLQWVESGH
jgi:N-hydroxyarylamine O-acetyltransferase